MPSFSVISGGPEDRCPEGEGGHPQGQDGGHLRRGPWAAGAGRRRIEPAEPHRHGREWSRRTRYPLEILLEC